MGWESALKWKKNLVSKKIEDTCHLEKDRSQKGAIRMTKETKKNTWQSAGNDSFNLELKDKSKALNKKLQI